MATAVVYDENNVGLPSTRLVPITLLYNDSIRLKSTSNTQACYFMNSAEIIKAKAKSQFPFSSTSRARPVSTLAFHNKDRFTFVLIHREAEISGSSASRDLIRETSLVDGSFSRF